MSMMSLPNKEIRKYKVATTTPKGFEDLLNEFDRIGYSIHSWHSDVIAHRVTCVFKLKDNVQ